MVLTTNQLQCISLDNWKRIVFLFIMRLYQHCRCRQMENGIFNTIYPYLTVCVVYILNAICTRMFFMCVSILIIPYSIHLLIFNKICNGLMIFNLPPRAEKSNSHPKLFSYEYCINFLSIQHKDSIRAKTYIYSLLRYE